MDEPQTPPLHIDEKFEERLRYLRRIAALEAELAQARAECEQAIAEVECLWVAIQSHCSAATIKAIESELESK